MSIENQANSACCPINLGLVCWVTGASSGQAFAIYDPTTQLVTYTKTDGTGTVPASDIVDCDAATTVNGGVSHIVAVTNGTVIAGKASVTLTNVGNQAGTVLGANIEPGETITYTAYFNPVTKQFIRVPAIAYTASAQARLSIVVQD